MAEIAAFLTHEAVKAANGSKFVDLAERDPVADVDGKFPGIVIGHDNSGAADYLDSNRRRFRKHEVIDSFSRVAESKTDAGTENTFSDTAVVSGTAVNTGKTDAVADDFRSIQFAVDPDAVSQSGGIIGGMQNQIIDSGKGTGWRFSGKFGKPESFQFAVDELGNHT